MDVKPQPASKVWHPIDDGIVPIRAALEALGKTLYRPKLLLTARHEQPLTLFCDAVTCYGSAGFKTQSGVRPSRIELLRVCLQGHDLADAGEEANRRIEHVVYTVRKWTDRATETARWNRPDIDEYESRTGREAEAIQWLGESLCNEGRDIGELIAMTVGYLDVLEQQTRRKMESSDKRTAARTSAFDALPPHHKALYAAIEKANGKFVSYPDCMKVLYPGRKYFGRDDVSPPELKNACTEIRKARVLDEAATTISKGCKKLSGYCIVVR